MVAQRILDFHFSLEPDWPLPDGFDLIYPYDDPATRQAMNDFYEKYYSDERSRVFLFGINPGRHGAGVTGIPFTDPIRLQEVCGIENPFKKRQELSSVFVYDFIDAYGGADAFHQKFYITSISPLGFLKDGLNINYYDDKQLQQSVEDRIIDNLHTQTKLVGTGRQAICMGIGKNYRYFKKLNERIQLFDEIYPLPHPRWVMQYRLKRKAEFIDQYLEVLNRFKK